MRLMLSFPFSITGHAAAVQGGGWVGKETRPETANVRLRTDGDQRGGWVRRLAVLAILGAAWAVVTPSVARAEYDNPPVECAGHTILFMEHQEAGSDDRLIVRRGQTVVRELKNIYFSEVRCVELTGDKTPELSVQYESGGNHCCWTNVIFQLQPVFRYIFSYESNPGVSGGITVQRDPGGRPVQGTIVYEYSLGRIHGQACHPSCAARMPQVFCHTGPYYDRYVDCTRRFPGVVQETLKTYTEELKEALKTYAKEALKTYSKDSIEWVRRQWLIEYVKGAALGVYGAYGLLDREPDGMAAVRRMVAELSDAEPVVMPWLAGCCLDRAADDGPNILSRWLKLR